MELHMTAAHLTDRGVVKVTGQDAKAFLDNIITCDLDKVSPERARLGALLTPQGKILFDFIVFQAPEEEAGGGYYLDVLNAFSADLTKRLGFYKLRAKVTVEDRSDTLAVIAGWADAPKPAADAGLIADDPRLPALGWRAIIAATDTGEFTDAGAGNYAAHRIALGIPEGGRDFLFSDAFPHEALMDQLGGVDFNKGCYIGQEVVSRMQHRGTARTRIVPAIYEGGFAAEPGADVMAGGKVLGKAGTGANGRGLLMIRLDRAADALAAGDAITSGGIPVRLVRPDWVKYAFPGDEEKAPA
jgi:folate-binding protein YgfZ